MSLPTSGKPHSPPPPHLLRPSCPPPLPLVVGTYLGAGPNVFQLSAASLGSSANKVERLELGRSKNRSSVCPSVFVTLASSQRHLVLPEEPFYAILPPPFYASDDEEDESDLLFGARWKPEARAGSGQREGRGGGEPT